MANSYVDKPVTDASVTEYTFTFHFLRLSHIQVWIKDSTATEPTFVQDSNFTASGSSGSGTVTLSGGFPTRNVGDTIRIKRVTPSTKAGRLVDFQGGSLSESDLDTTFLQNLYIAQENIDAIADTMGKSDSDGVSWDAASQRIRNVGAPSGASDAVRKQDLDGIQTTGGNLPTPTGTGYMMISDSSTWLQKRYDAIRTDMGLGTAALVNTGTSAAEVPTTADADARYLLESNNLSDLDNAGTARTNLGLGTSATLDTGTTIGDVPILVDDGGGSPVLQALDGQNLDLSANAIAQGRIGAYAEFNITASSVLAGSYAAMPLDAIGQSLYNGSGNVAVDTGNDDFTLLAGNYWVELRLHIKNTAATDANLNWKIVADPDGTPSDIYSNAITYEIPQHDGGEPHTLTIVQKVLLQPGSTTEYDIQMQETNSATASIVDAQISVTNIT